MAAPTNGFTTAVSELTQGPRIQRKIKVNPFAAATDGKTGPALPPAPLVGRVWPR